MDKRLFLKNIIFTPAQVVIQ